MDTKVHDGDDDENGNDDDPANNQHQLILKTSIHALPEVVFEYILSQVSPYNDHLACRLVSKAWNEGIKSTIGKLQRDFIASLKSMNIVWQSFYPGVAPSITARYSHSCVTDQDAMYIFGGCTVSATTFNDLWKLDLSTKQWIRPLATGSYPPPKACSSFVKYLGKLILFGGWTYSSASPIHHDWKLFNHIHEFDPHNHLWSLITCKTECPAMAGHSASIIDDQMVVFGGLMTERNSPHPFRTSNQLWTFNFQTKEWSHIQPMNGIKPSPRYGHSAITLDKTHILILGGCGGPNMLFSDVWLLDMSALWHWKQIDLRTKDPNINPILSFHPCIGIKNLAVVLSKAHNSKNQPSPKCKFILKMPSQRIGYEAEIGVGEKSKSQLQPQISPSERRSKMNENSSASYYKLRPSARLNREKQLEGLQRMERRLKSLKSLSKSTSPIRTSIIKIPTPQHNSSPMCLYVLDTSTCISDNFATWQDQKYHVEGPEEIMLYSLVVGRAELVMFGGIKRDKDCKHTVTNSPPDHVSNFLHIASTKKIVI